MSQDTEVGMTRRGFLERAGSFSAALLLGAADVAEAAVPAPAGCFGTRDVDVAFYPVRLKTTVGITPLLKGPFLPTSADDPIIVRHRSATGATLPILLKPGAVFGLQSIRNGLTASGKPRDVPPIRPVRTTRDGKFVYGYVVTGVVTGGYRKQGWIPVSAIAGLLGANEAATSAAAFLTGPAGFDRDARRGAQPTPGQRRPSQQGAGSVTPDDTYHVIGGDLMSRMGEAAARKSIQASSENYYLRWARDSSSFFWLQPGDRVKSLGTVSTGIRVAGGTQIAAATWHAVQVTSAKYAPEGCRGWIEATALRLGRTRNTRTSPSQVEALGDSDRDPQAKAHPAALTAAEFTRLLAGAGSRLTLPGATAPPPRTAPTFGGAP